MKRWPAVLLYGPNVTCKYYVVHTPDKKFVIRTRTEDKKI